MKMNFFGILAGLYLSANGSSEYAVGMGAVIILLNGVMLLWRLGKTNSLKELIE